VLDAAGRVGGGGLNGVRGAASGVLNTTGRVLSTASRVLSATGRVLSTAGRVLSATGRVLHTTSGVLNTTGRVLSAAGRVLDTAGRVGGGSLDGVRGNLSTAGRVLSAASGVLDAAGRVLGTTGRDLSRVLRGDLNRVGAAVGHGGGARALRDGRSARGDGDVVGRVDRAGGHGGTSEESSGCVTHFDGCLVERFEKVCLVLKRVSGISWWAVKEWTTEVKSWVKDWKAGLAVWLKKEKENQKSAGGYQLLNRSSTPTE
jgi:hypothetical protein